jgi:hypothetical protein
MLVFMVLTVIGVGGVVAWRSGLRYRAAQTAEGKAGARFSFSDYFAWARPRLKRLSAPPAWKNAFGIGKRWARPLYPRWTIGILLALGGAVAYQIVSGFFFAFFVRRGLFGLPLLAHVAAGGLFALALSALLLWRGRDHRIDDTDMPARERFGKPAFHGITEAGLSTLLFWLFAFFGLVQVLTALGSMLPIFHYDAQGVFVTIHRYGALGILLTVLVFLDLTLIPRHRP